MGHSPLLLQLVIILATARVLGLVLRYFGQSPVIGEMAAGIALGPVVFGAMSDSTRSAGPPSASFSRSGALSSMKSI